MQLSVMFFVCGFCMLFKILIAEACSANQQSSTNLSGASGKFPSTGKIQYLPVSATCRWTITAPVGQVLRIKIVAIFKAKPCDGEYLRIHDGASEASNKLAEYTCNGGMLFSDEYFFSSNRNLWLEVKTGLITNSTAIEFSYQAHNFQDCSVNKTLDALQSPEEKNFSSPYYPHGFPMNMTCGWYITAPENHIVSLYLRSGDWSNSQDMNNVEVYDVDGSELIPIAFRRGHHDSSPYVALGEVFSKFRSVFVVFKSDGKPSDFEDRGITGQYSAVKPARSCSTKNSYSANMNIFLRDLSGTIKTPGYPQGYSDSFINNCFWKIIAPKGRVVRVDFISFSLANNDQVTITDSINGLNPQSITRSGKQASFTFYSSGHELSIKVLSYSDTSGPGFIANYTSVPAVISGTCVPKQNSMIEIAAEGLTFSTPGFPSSFSKKGVCRWNITVPTGEFIKLIFWKNYGECDENYVKVYDLTNSTRISLGKFCDKYREQVVYSKGNNLLIEYTSLRKVSSNGFIATYESLKSSPAEYSCLTMGKNLEDTNGEFASYEYPLHYSNNVKCSWVINRPAGFVVQLTFHSFNLQQSRDCEADYVEIKQNEKNSEFNAKVIGRFCGSSIPPVILSNRSNVFVDFVTDMSRMYPGFHASYKVLPDPAMGSCKNPGQNNIIPLSGETGSLFSPLYPRDFPDRIMCTWVITVPEGHFVKLRIKFFRMGYTCGTSSLQIRDGQSSSSNLLKKFCGSEYESSVFSSSRYLLVQFDSKKEYLSGKSLFDAVFEAVKQVPAPFSCTSGNLINRLKTKTGSLASYNYPLPYDDSVECVWIINVHSDYKIKLSFDFFNLSQSSDCSDDYVEVRDGQFDTSALIGKFCGSEKPESITSDSWDLHVTFKSSGKTKYPGFKASYERKKSTAAILKIVGYCVGGLAALIAVIGGCIKWYTIRQRHNAAMGYIEAEGAEDMPVEEQATKL